MATNYGGSTPGGERRALVLAGALAMLCWLPYLMSPIIEASDAGSHVSRIYVMSQGPGSAVARFFQVHWRWIGNLGVDLPALLLAPLCGAEAAVRIVTAATASLTLFAIHALARSAHGTFVGPAALALPFVFSQPVAWGFLNYDLSVALALLVAAAWLRRPPQGAATACLFGIAGCAVWTAHAMGWGILLIAVAGFEIGAVWPDIRRAKGRLARFIPLLLPVVPMLLWRSDGAGPLFAYDAQLVRAKAMHFLMVLRAIDPLADIVMLGLVALLALLGLVLARRIERRMAVAAALLVIAVVLAPTRLFGSWAADMRLAPVAAILCIAAIPPGAFPRANRGFLLVGAALLLVRIAALAAQWHGDGARHRAQLALLDAVPRGSRVGFIVLKTGCGGSWRLRAEPHLGSYAIVRRDAFSNTMFSVPGSDIVSVRQPADVAWIDGSQMIETRRCPSGVPDPAAMRSAVKRVAGSFDYLWIVASDGGPLPRLAPLPDFHRLGTAPGALMLGRR